MSVRSVLVRHRGAAGFAVGVLAAGVLGSGIALAAIPSTATGTVTACVSRASGATRIIDFQAGRRCSTREQTITWSKGVRYRGAWASRTTYAPLDVVSWNGGSYVARVTTSAPPSQGAHLGPLALHGAAGLPGAPGLPGTVGPSGPQGLQGLQGHAGDAGPQGPQGVPGAAGATGPVGPAGAAGAVGPAGISGYKVVPMSFDLPANAHTSLNPKCPSGTLPVAGGGHIGTKYAGWGDAKVAYIAESDVDEAGTGWVFTLVTTNTADPSTHFVVHVICAAAS